jgi:hypothetical protein
LALRRDAGDDHDRRSETHQNRLPASATSPKAFDISKG